MFEIVKKEQLNNDTFSMWIKAPLVAPNAKAGQFIMLRVNGNGERIPLTISDAADGNVRIVFQAIGKTTFLLSEKNEGDFIADFVGPLGMPTELPEAGKVCVIGGGLGSAIALPQVKELYKHRVDTTVILGFRNKDLVLLEDEFKANTNELIIATDDGSNGRKGFVTNVLEEQIEKGEKFDLVIAIGPIPMMKAVCEVTKKHEIKTIVSMNSTMIDGTGMCGCCRVTVGGEVKFACVDGPDFDGHQVDFDEAGRRSRYFRDEESEALEEHKCRLTADIELVDIVDENNNLTGEVVEKELVHQKGLLHREAVIWVMSNDGEVLMQKRASEKKLKPNKWSITGGHVKSGESPDVAAKRELFEEIGIKGDLEFLFVARVSEYQNNKFKYMYFLKSDTELEDYKIQYEELSELKYISLEELERIVKDEDEDYTFSKRDYMPKIIQELKKRV